MKDEEKDILIKDICARVPYGTKCKIYLGDKCPALSEKNKFVDDEILTVDCVKKICTFKQVVGYDYGKFSIENVKPYLRSTSSMTKEEKDEYELFFSYGEHGWDEYTIEDEVPKILDWLNAHHFDYRGLIPKGLALEALEGMYNV